MHSCNINLVQSKWSSKGERLHSVLLYVQCPREKKGFVPVHIYDFYAEHGTKKNRNVNEINWIYFIALSTVCPNKMLPIKFQQPQSPSPNKRIQQIEESEEAKKPFKWMWSRVHQMCNKKNPNPCVNWVCYGKCWSKRHSTIQCYLHFKWRAFFSHAFLYLSLSHTQWRPSNFVCQNKNPNKDTYISHLLRARSDIPHSRHVSVCSLKTKTKW